jgi:hypothetical protein
MELDLWRAETPLFYDAQMAGLLRDPVLLACAGRCRGNHDCFGRTASCLSQAPSSGRGTRLHDGDKDHQIGIILTSTGPKAIMPVRFANAQNDHGRSSAFDRVVRNTVDHAP